MAEPFGTILNLLGGIWNAWKLLWFLAGLLSKKPFKILSVAILIRLTDCLGKEEDRKERRLDVQTMYTIRGIRGLTDAVDGMNKRYTKSDARKLFLRKGTTKQANQFAGPTNVGTIARFNVEPGEIKTIVFRCEVICDLPFPEGRAIRDAAILRPDEAWWGYPNYDGMTLPEVTIVMESPTSDLTMISNQRPAFRFKADGQLDHSKVSTGRSKAKAGSEVLWARWRDVRKNELVAFRYKWSDPSAVPENRGSGS